MMKRVILIFCLSLCLLFFKVSALNSSSYPDAFSVEVTPETAEENQAITLKVTALKNWKIMTSYLGDFTIWIEDVYGNLIQSNESKLPDGGWWSMSLDNKGVRVYENWVSISKKWTYTLRVSEFTDDNISWATNIRILWDNSWIQELSTYSQEYIDAYNRAYWKWITTQSIDKANLEWNLTRQAMAKMIVVFAEDMLNMKPDTAKACKFSDIDNNSDLAPYIKEACQLGIMGQNTEKFSPTEIVSRAQFGTILSRALWWNTYNTENPYYKNHLQHLKEKGIMTKIENPESKEEKRWNVMIMLQRAEKMK